MRLGGLNPRVRRTAGLAHPKQGAVNKSKGRRGPMSLCIGTYYYGKCNSGVS